MRNPNYFHVFEGDELEREKETLKLERDLISKQFCLMKLFDDDPIL